MLFEEYDTHFFGDSETLDFIESSLLNVVRSKYRYDDNLQLRLTTERPLEAYIINYLRKSHDFMIYVTYGTRDCGCWSFCNGKEISASLNHHRRDMYGPRSYKKFVDKENLLMDVTYNLLHGMSYKGLVDIAKLADVEENLLIQKCYLVDPVYEYQVYEYQDIVLDEETSAENSRKYLEFCKANKNMIALENNICGYCHLLCEECEYGGNDTGLYHQRCQAVLLGKCDRFHRSRQIRRHGRVGQESV